MTTSPDGQRLPVGRRLAEIRARYGPDHLVSRAITRSAPELTGAVARVTRRRAAWSSASVAEEKLGDNERGTALTKQSS